MTAPLTPGQAVDTPLGRATVRSCVQRGYEGWTVECELVRSRARRTYAASMVRSVESERA